MDLTLQVIVVDGGSFDGCGEMLASSFPQVEFIQSAENIGFAAANNLGLARVAGEFVLLLNPDTELRPGSLQKLLKAAGTLQEPGLIGPKILNPDGSLQETCARAFPTPLNQALDSNALRRLFPKAGLWGSGDAFQSPQPTEVEALSGACMLIRTKALRGVGGFSAEFFMYGEDYDLCMKVRRLGLKNYFVPDAEILHHGGQSSERQFKKFSTVWMRVSDHAVIKKWFGWRAAFSYRALQGLSACARLLLLTGFFLISPGRRRAMVQHSILKWWTILRWTLGLENWARLRSAD